MPSSGSPGRATCVVRGATCGVAGLALAVLCATPLAAHAQSAGEIYAQTFTRERAARDQAPPSLDVVRAVAKAYERLVIRFPTSGFSDNALWQGAGLHALAYSLSGADEDRQQAVRLLTWLRREYPASSLKQQAATQIAAIAALSAPPVPGTTPRPPLSTPIVGAASASSSGPPALLKSVTSTTLPRGERLTFEFTREVAYSGDRIENPDRLFVDFANTTAAPVMIDQTQKHAGTLVTALRVGRRAESTTRVVLDLGGRPRSSTFTLYEPFRLVIDVESGEPPPLPALVVRPSAVLALPAPPADPPRQTAPPPAAAPAVPPAAARREDSSVKPGAATTTTASVAPASPPSPQPVTPSANAGGDFSLARQLGLRVSRIVIDAGHGGHDPGAQANGLSEAELVLDIALRVQKLLADVPGVEVVLTRATDEFVPLEARTAFANREGADRADVFLSIHANASPRTAARGVETYFLNFATNPTAEAVAARENATSSHTMGTLPDILKAIALNSKLAESRDLATIVQTSLVRRLAVQNKGTLDLGVKQAPFVVLIGAQMPSVLAEISFLTNKTEAALLKQSSYRQRIAQALCDAVLKYQASLKKVTTVAGSTK
jgi:N-acetylmuramoyl-L-alanine amidase